MADLSLDVLKSLFEKTYSVVLVEGLLELLEALDNLCTIICIQQYFTYCIMEDKYFLNYCILPILLLLWQTTNRGISTTAEHRANNIRPPNTPPRIGSRVGWDAPPGIITIPWLTMAIFFDSALDFVTNREQEYFPAYSGWTGPGSCSTQALRVLLKLIVIPPWTYSRILSLEQCPMVMFLLSSSLVKETHRCLYPPVSLRWHMRLLLSSSHSITGAAESQKHVMLQQQFPDYHWCLLYLIFLFWWLYYNDCIYSIVYCL